MKPYVVNVVGPMYEYDVPGGAPSPHAVPGALYVRMVYIDSWRGPTIRIVDRIEGNQVRTRLTRLSRIRENGIFMLGDEEEQPYGTNEYAWGNNRTCFLKPMAACMFSMAGVRPGLIAQRYGARILDHSATHAFIHQDGEYQPLCHYTVMMRGGTFLRLQPIVTCSYCRRKIDRGEVNHAGFMRAKV